ncbi:MAG: asparagine synthase (glutamine-hydrolyzing) [Bacteroidota bacterium]
MCGIAGIYSRAEIGHGVISDMTNMLLHRGPDAHSTYRSDSGNLAFGHTRLSIIDLSQAANQPMCSFDDRYVVIFNGEIYNFALVRKEIQRVNPGVLFRTHSDTEVILNAFITWGPEMVKKLDGMFAIALFDTIDKKLFLFRDRIGKKPIFYFSTPEHFVFASEIKSMLKHDAVAASKLIDRQAIHEFLHLGYIPEPKTIYKSIAKFPAGSWAEVTSDLTVAMHSYWTVTGQLEGAIEEDTVKAKEILRQKLHQAVQKRLISDVPVGSFLSGGTDSSLVTAIASEYTTGKFKTFNIGFKDQAFDEHHSAARVAACLKTEHYEYLLEEREAKEILETYLHHFDEPFADTSAIPTMLVSKLARKEVTVALTGDGGDELFLGYGSHAWASRLDDPFF